MRDMPFPYTSPHLFRCQWVIFSDLSMYFIYHPLVVLPRQELPAILAVLAILADQSFASIELCELVMKPSKNKCHSCQKKVLEIGLLPTGGEVGLRSLLWSVWEWRRWFGVVAKL